MPEKECVLNELSLDDVDFQGADSLDLVEQLAAILGVVGVRDLWVWERLKVDHDSRWYQIARRLQREVRDPDRRRNALRLLDRALAFGENLATDVWFRRSPGNGATVARGLGRAFWTGGLAMSLPVADHWNSAWIEIAVTTGEAGEDTAPKSEKVRNVSQVENLKQHHDWSALDDAGRLRIKLASHNWNHVEASRYHKHVCGSTNDVRRANASRPAGVGQYFATRDDRAVSDDDIRTWEKSALERVARQDSSVVIGRGGSVYHVYCDVGQDVGFLASTGEVTSWIRVEWSAEHIHSHPRRPPRGRS